MSVADQTGKDRIDDNVGKAGFGGLIQVKASVGLSACTLAMITIPQLTAQALGSFLATETRARFGSSSTDLSELLPYAARLALDCIGNSDALYHNVEHSMLVTFLPGTIFLSGGRCCARRRRATMRTSSWHALSMTSAMSGGYFRATKAIASLPTPQAAPSACRAARRTQHLPPIRSIAPSCSHWNVSLLQREPRTPPGSPWAIEYTRVPYKASSSDDDLNQEEGLLLRAADLIGQLGDPNYMKKSNALFYEFEEIGLNKTLGYKTPADIVYKFPQFYWTNVAPQIQTAIRYLNVTSSGRQWIANIYVNVYRAERED